MASQYGQGSQAGESDGTDMPSEASVETLRERHPELNGLAAMNDEQKIDMFQGILADLREDLDNQQRA
ncbi:hypothetical protein OZX57_04900 [Bifidobacterium sp. ESL0682]|uniref:hypothetical protein n=1 Tax=Bifidobacterium sp. ESL0682 TaxID=2983212 RepID=UPI0023F9E165|nr:hypothetical protein [Bifidobacterium sp. ESL0682]WEV41398.1 hypothetical protein OZX57_04900 [Bifidobacterium sp. ESL0682]